MPTGHCNYPAHHGPSAGPPAGFVAALIAGAVIIAAWHTVLLMLAVCGFLAVAGVCVVLLVHSHRATPYDTPWTGPEPRQAASAEVLQARVDALELHLAERPAIAAPQQHLHLHGVTAADLAAITAARGNPAAIVNARRDRPDAAAGDRGDGPWSDEHPGALAAGPAGWRDRAAEMEDRARDLLSYDMDPVTASLLGLHTAEQRMAWARTASWRWAGYRGPLGEHGHIEPEDGTR